MGSENSEKKGLSSGTFKFKKKGGEFKMMMMMITTALKVKKTGPGSCITVKNFSKEVSEKAVEKLEQRLKEILPIGIGVTIKVYDHPRDVHSSRFLWFRKLFGYNPDQLDGKVKFPGPVILYKRAFRDDRILLHVALHEIGHYLDKRNLLTFLLPFWLLSPWREKRADAFAAKFGFGH